MLLALFLTLAVAATAETDACAQYTSCKTCAGFNGCGWCSTPVAYADGTIGPQCVSPSAGKAFTCSGLFSTDTCQQGYDCDAASGACRLALPGQGVSHDACEAACTVGPTTAVYACLPNSTTCVVVPPGTPGSASQADCELHCVTPPNTVYKCNPSNQQCEIVPPGTSGSSSLEVCTAVGCDSGDWGCNIQNYQCVQGYGNFSNATCARDCRPPNDPCMYETTCATCLAANPECGWCSENVTYASGMKGSQCAGVNSTILPFNCKGTYSTKSCDNVPTPPPSGPMTPSPDLPPYVDCPKGSMVLLQYNCADQTCANCDTGPAAECKEPHCTLFCSGKCQPVPSYNTSFMWSCNGNSAGVYNTATLVHFLSNDECTGPTNPAGTGGSGTYPLDSCGSPYGPNNPPQYNTFKCVPCGGSCVPTTPPAYKCDWTKTCVEVPPGTPGSASQEVCLQSCH